MVLSREAPRVLRYSTIAPPRSPLSVRSHVARCFTIDPEREQEHDGSVRLQKRVNDGTLALHVAVRIPANWMGRVHTGTVSSLGPPADRWSQVNAGTGKRERQDRAQDQAGGVNRSRNKCSGLQSSSVLLANIREFCSD